ncbi:DUF2723 domain-containing protein [Maribacter algarum]|uniref:DUF2723 domain-containing protein n=1 Tax=Maribacter algarum (ex Zhang et al. 2020) TaxID=2578118 RepID=A0A5S3QG27_9FLAO|nr:DUF2723 domain-containing protein [Maribacter algarum]TMM56237.1 DUF2723 domain-containing protein [Maribacter algarum]
MTKFDFRRWNILLGWSVFAISFIVYALTVEPTVSFWDAGEYIASSAKLQVAHPPGAPLLQMLGAFFALFATDKSQIALMVNYVSVVSSAFTILFLFWTITNLLQNLTKKTKTSLEKDLAILGSGFIGALAFTFSDSFWFNATETEVYSTASLLMALLLWLGLKWTDDLNSPRSNKWLLLISFVVGLTFGVQFMGFLAIPSIVLLYYFKKDKTVTAAKFIVANIVSVIILMLVFKFALTYVLKLFGWSEVFFVNSFGLPFNSGSLIMGLFIAASFYFLLRYTRKKGYKKANLIVLSVLFLFLGFSSWLSLPIRASAKTVINENDPSDARSLLAYFNREQYPATDSPFYGAYYSDKFASEHPDKDDRPKYERDEKIGRYTIVNEYKGALRGSSEKHMGWLPRMWSEQNAENYMRYYGVLKFSIKPQFRSNKDLQSAVKNMRQKLSDGEVDVVGYIKFLTDISDYIDVHPPTLGQNIEYLFHFQFGYMYWRYFMWNFTGRQNDEQGRFDGNGEWISGITVLDSLRLGSQENLPKEVLENKGRNTYFFFPLVLGLIGLVFQLQKNWKQFWVLFVFFLFTGLAIQFYTNPPIFQPRERDYSLVGSFYIFTIWIGFGVYGMYEQLKNYGKPRTILPIVLVVCFLAVPFLLAQQNWDDHDRSNRYTALSMAKSYLDSTEKDAGSILFTIGDIDTFPLWYAQDIEGYRTDTRVVVTTYFGTDWYIEQMKRKAYESEPIPSQLTYDLYRYGSRDAIYYAHVTDKRWSIQDFMKWVSSDAPQTKVKSLLEQQGRDISGYSDSYLDAVFYPTYKIRVPVNKKKVLETGLVKAKDSAEIVDYIDIDLPQSGIGKSSLLMLDIIANNDWERPIYFSGGSFDEQEYIWMTDYLQLDGLVYKLVPIKTETESIFDKGRIDSELMYDIVKKWEWGNSGSPDIYHDPQTRKQGGVTYRITLARLLEKLLKEKKIERAKEVIEIAMTNIPVEHFEFYTYVEPFFDGYYKVGETTKARDVYSKLKTVYQAQLFYYSEMPLDEQYKNFEAIYGAIRGYQRNIDILLQNDNTELAEKETSEFNEHINRFGQFLE